MSKEQGVGSRESKTSELLVMLVVVAAIVGAAILPRYFADPTGQSHLGRPIPPLSTVAGWLNTDTPLTNADLQGKLVVADFWATWCGPCRTEMPHLAEALPALQDQGVVVVGFTGESEASLTEVQDFIGSVEGFEWPVAYGASEVSAAMDVQMIPTLVLFDETGTSVWSGHSVEELQAELARRGRK